MKEKRINRVIANIASQFFNGIKDDTVSNTRTMKVGVELIPEMKEKLDILMNDADLKRREVLENLKRIFYENPFDLIEAAGKSINITKNNIEIEKIDNAISPINTYSIYKSETIKKDKNGNNKKSINYFCINNKDIDFNKNNKTEIKKDIKGIIVKIEQEKNKEDEIISKNIEKDKIKFVIEKFEARGLNNILSASFRNGKKETSDKETNLYKTIKKTLNISFNKEFNGGNFIESFCSNIAKEVCSFLDKYYNIQNDIQKTIANNLKNISILNKSVKIENLPNNIENKIENDEYNKIVKQNNMLINLAKQQYEKNTKADKNQEYKKEFQNFKPLKGFPSFPLVEKRKELNYNELNKILDLHLEKAKLFWNFITDSQMKEAMKHFYNRIVYKWFEYYYKLEATEPEKDNNYQYNLNKWTPSFIIDVIIERIDKKIEKIKTNTDQDKKQKTEWLRGKSLIIFEYLRQNHQEEFAKVRAEFDLQSSINAGFISKNIEDKKVFEIIGFSEGKKSAILVENLNEITTTGLIKNNYSLAFNVSKSNGKFKLDNKSNLEGYVGVPIYKKDENNNDIYKKDKNGNFELDKKGNKKPEKLCDDTKLEKISFDREGTFILPLKFGKRYAREYLYNNELNFENKGITLNNARVIKEGDKYFVAITFTKLKGNEGIKETPYNAIIGVDRGEKLPVAVVITNLKGNVIEKPELEICKLFAEKQKNIDNQKKEQASRTGKYDDDLKNKAKNLSKATIEKIGAELLYYATKYKGLIVLEDLNREFGINPIMATRQYSKIEDFLSRKLKENGLMSKNGNIVSNTRDGLLGKVLAMHTSKTCSNCGCVFASEKIKSLEPYLKNNLYYIILDGKEISLDIDYEVWIKSKGKKEKFNANEEIKKLKEKDTKKNQELIEKVLFNSLNPRKTQESFICPICGHTENADVQAGLNIARRWVFEKEMEINNSIAGGKKSSHEKEEYNKLKETKDKIPYWKAWENFCKRNKELWNQNN